jgi:predicted MFS family arabinose efflux permease
LFVLFLFIFLRRERAIEHPILELRFFRNRAFWVGNLLGFTASFAMYGIIAFMPLLAQSLHGGTALQAGLVITPMSLGWSAASIVAGRMSHRVGEPLLIRSGMAFMTAGFLLAMMTWAGSPVWFLMLCVGLTGVGMGCQTPALMLTVQQCLEAQNIGVATSTQMLARTIGGAVGVSVMGAAVTGSMVSMIRRLEESGLLASFPASARAHFAEPQKLLDAGLRPALTGTQLDLVLSAFVDALHSVFIIGVIVLVVSIALSFLLPRILTRLSVAGKGGDAA